LGAHDDYGKHVMRVAAGSAYHDGGASVEINYSAGRPARIDGTVGSEIAVEVESRVPKQVRGAVLDLLCHPFPKKLLVLLPVHMTDAECTAEQCRFIFRKFMASENFRVVVLDELGPREVLERHVAIVQAALKELGFQKSKAAGNTTS
jgi:hypothetical protein